MQRCAAGHHVVHQQHAAVPHPGMARGAPPRRRRARCAGAPRGQRSLWAGVSGAQQQAGVGAAGARRRASSSAWLKPRSRSRCAGPAAWAAPSRPLQRRLGPGGAAHHGGQARPPSRAARKLVAGTQSAQGQRYGPRPPGSHPAAAARAGRRRTADDVRRHRQRAGGAPGAPAAQSGRHAASHTTRRPGMADGAAGGQAAPHSPLRTTHGTSESIYSPPDACA
jgi:hypothetical protein